MTDQKIDHKRLLEKRRSGYQHNFEALLYKQASGDAAALEVEHEALFARFMPGANDEIRRAAFRIIFYMVHDLEGLLNVMVPGHNALLHGYLWGVNQAEEFVEGEGSAWLFLEETEFTKAFDDTNRAVLSNFFFRSQYMSMAMRAWPRLQAIHFDMSVIEEVALAWKKKWDGKKAGLRYCPDDIFAEPPSAVKTAH